MNSSGKKQKFKGAVTELYKAEEGTDKSIPLYSNKISAGFPSPAEDYIENRLDLNEYLIKNPSSTFFAKVQGDSMVKVGINDGDILIVDRSLEPVTGKIIIGVLNGEFTVKRIIKKGKQFFLQPENDNFKPIEITNNPDFSIWGIVTHSIHKL